MIDIFSLHMTRLSKDKTIRVYTPASYDGVREYPVLYMHDGQNLFSDTDATYGKSWNISNILDELGIELIVVGIDSGEGLERLDELSPFINHVAQYAMDDFVTRPVGGRGDDYMHFMTDELKPHIDATYKTLTSRENTYIAGSSMGGLMSIYMGVKRSDVYSRVAAFSSALWFADNELFRFMDESNIEVIDKIYLDIGTMEHSMEKDISMEYLLTNHAMNKLLSKRLHEGSLRYIVEEGAKHNEAAWEKRFRDMIRWFTD